MAIPEHLKFSQEIYSQEATFLIERGERLATCQGDRQGCILFPNSTYMLGYLLKVRLEDVLKLEEETPSICFINITPITEKGNVLQTLIEVNWLQLNKTI